MKLIKGLAISIAVIITALVLYLTLFFNINQLKPQLTDSIEDATGYKANIDGELGWKLFPTIGIEVNGLEIENPSGFSKKELIRIDHVVADVALLPLLSKNIEVKTVQFKDMKLNLLTDKGGRTNLYKLQEKGNTANTKPQPEVNKTKQNEQSTIDIGAVSIAGIDIENIVIYQQNLQVQSEQTLKLEYFNLAKFGLDSDSSFKMKATVKQPELNAEVTGNGVINVASTLQSLSIKSFEANLSAKGNQLPTGHINAVLKVAANVDLEKQTANLDVSQVQINDIKGNGSLRANYGLKVPNVNISFNFGDVDLTPYFPRGTENANSKVDEETAQASVANEVSNKEPDLSALASINGSAKVTIKSIKAKNVHASNLSIMANISNSVLTIKDISSDLYQGKLQGKASLDARKSIASYNFSANLTKFQFQPLLKDALDTQEISGETNLSISGSGHGVSPLAIKQKLAARGSVAVTDGAYHGVDIGKMLSNFESQLKGEAAPKETEVDKTLFENLGTEFAINNGVMQISNTALTSPVLKVKGNGTANLLTDKLAYKLSVNVTESNSHKSGLNQLRGRDIPFLVTGSLSDPKFRLDTQAVLKQQLDKEKDKLKDKIKKKLFGKFGF
ncbi:AsmA family protein [Parashewanella curva]|uniref:AsmA family protein n=1 Tax=Parashewanella curva TaxID=2338552 RepID=A0A3L8PWT8_9GAMM|nr:AsmA family protein [Parashewanella curva]RLV59259.1 AsmA family protein [Parashewanella curva]